MEHNKFEMQKEMKLQDQIRLNNERRKIGVDMTLVQQAKNKLSRVESEYKVAKQVRARVALVLIIMIIIIIIIIH